MYCHDLEAMGLKQGRAKLWGLFVILEPNILSAGSYWRRGGGVKRDRGMGELSFRMTNHTIFSKIIHIRGISQTSSILKP